MSRFLRRGAVAAPIVALLAAGVVQTGSASAAPPAPVACGAVITSNTVLQNDVGPCPGTGITIGADNVMLNLNGHKVSGAVSAYGSALGQTKGIHFDKVSKSHVKGGEVTGFAVGVRIDGGAMNSVRSSNIHDNVAPNALDNGDGIAIWNSSNNTVMDNTVNRNGPYSGIAVVTGPYSVFTDPAITITGNVIKNNTFNLNNVQTCTSPAGCLPRDPNTGAIQPAPGAPARVPQGAQFTGSVDNGIRVEGPNATNTTIEGNTTNDNGDNGIFLQPSCHNVFMPVPPGATPCEGDVGNINTIVKNNTANHNGFGRASTNSGGITVFAMGLATKSASQALMQGNTTMKNFSDGIDITTECASAAAPNLGACSPNSIEIKNNISSENGRHGINLQAHTFDIDVRHNTTDLNKGNGIAVATPNFGGSVNRSAFATTVLTLNNGHGNMGVGVGVVAGDGTDMSSGPGCTATWVNNNFGTVNKPCVV